MRPVLGLIFLTGSLAGQGLPDLVVQSITVPNSGIIGATPKSQVPGTQTNVSATVLNHGTADSPAFLLEFYLGTKPNVSVADMDTKYGCNVAALPVSSSYTCQLTIGLPAGIPAGTYYLAALADPQGLVPELSRTNNSQSSAISLSTAPTPNFNAMQAGSFDPSDGATPLRTALQYPSVVRADPVSSDIYLADTYNHRVRKISNVGTTLATVTTILGNGIPSTAGEQAWLDSPGGLAVDEAHNVYVSDTNHHRVLKVTAAGAVSTIAGTGAPGAGADGTLATQAALNEPTGLALHPITHDLYISDQMNNRILRVTNGKIFVVAGGNGAGFCGDGGLPTSGCFFLPAGLAFDPNGDLFVADQGNFRIRKVNASITTAVGNGQLGPISDNGAALTSPIGTPLGVAIDQQGNLFIADSQDCVVWKVAGPVTGSSAVSRFAGTGVCNAGADGASAFVSPVLSMSDVALSNPAPGLPQDLFMADPAAGRIHKVDGTQGTLSTVAGAGMPAYANITGDAASGSLNAPGAMAADANGQIYFVDAGNHVVRTISGIQNTLSTIAGNGIAADAGDGGPALSASFVQPGGVAVDSKGSVFIADNAAQRVRKVAGGTISTFVGTGLPGNIGPVGQGTSFPLNTPDSLAMDAQDNLYIADTKNYRILKVTPAGAVSTVAGTGTMGSVGDGGPAAKAQLQNVTGLAFDPLGGLYISETNSGFSRIRKINAQGQIGTVIDSNGAVGFSGDSGLATSAMILGPAGLASDISGDLYFSDRGNQRIRRLGTDGTISTVAGSGHAGFTVALNPVQSALNAPQGIAVDAAGNVLVSDSRNNRILKLSGSSGCPVVVSPGSFVFAGDSAQAFSFQVTTAASCQWSAVPSASWIHMVSGSPNTGPGAVNCTIDVNPTPGAVRTGSIQVSNQNIPISQGTALPPPVINSVVDVFTYQPGVSPGAWVSIFATNLPGTPVSWSPAPNGPLPTTLNGVSVTFGGVPAALSYVGPGQINALVPGTVANTGSIPIVVSNPAASQPFAAPSTRYLPAMASAPDSSTPPHFHVTALDSLTLAVVGTAGRPAINGEMIDLYCIGLGPILGAPLPTSTNFSGLYALDSGTSLQVVIGQPGSLDSVTVNPVAAVLISPGLYLVRVVIPSTLTLSGDQPIYLNFGLSQSAANVYLKLL